MFFNSFHDFIAMGGYAGYVWSAFAITFIAMAAIWCMSVKRRKRILTEVRNKLERQARIDAAKKMENTL